VAAPGAQAPGPAAGAVALASGSTVTQVDAVMLPAPPGLPEVTATSFWCSSVPPDGEPLIACCNCEPLFMRP